MIEIGDQISHYKIVEKVGSGGMGVVYKAEDLNLNRTIALKFLPPEVTCDEDSKLRFIREAQSASAMQHTNICTIHEIDETDDGHMFICMDYYDGASLKDKIKHAPLSLAESLRYIIQIAEGLDRAHESGVYHRDIKPANIMLTDHGEVKIVDFGLVKLAGEHSKSDSGKTVGTILYMSPEQIRGEIINQSADIWSLGVVFYEMLTGKVPFSGEYEQAIVYEILNKNPRSIRKQRNDIPIEIERIIFKCLQKNKSKRYQNVRELKDDIIKIQHEEMMPEAVKLINRIRISAGAETYLIALLVFLVITLSVIFWPGVFEDSEERYIAVLPFTNVGNLPENQVYCDALTEIVTSKLTQLERFSGSLYVVPSVDVRKFEVTSTSEARQMLNAGYVITGSIHKVSDKLRVLLNLVDTESHTQIRSADLNFTTSSLGELEVNMLTNLSRMLELEITEASEPLKQIEKERVSQVYDYYLQGFGYLQRYEIAENIETAINLFRKALSIDSSYVLAYAGLGEAYWKKYEVDKNVNWTYQAQEYCRKALALDGEKPQVHLTLGIIYNGTGKYELALKEFNKILDKEPFNANALRGKATALQNSGKTDMAEKVFMEAIEVCPGYWAGYSHLGVFYYTQGKYEEACRQFEKVTELTPNNPRGYSNLGAMYFFLEKWDQSINMFERTLEIKPDYVVYSNLGSLYFFKNNFRKSAEAFKKALEINDQDYRIWGNLGSCYYWMGADKNQTEPYTRKAVELALKQLELNPQNIAIIVDIAGYYEGLDQNEKAHEMMAQAVALNPTELEDFFNITDIYEQLGNRDQALYWMEKLLKNGYSMAKIHASPGLKKLLTDSRFTAMLKKYDPENL